MKLVLLAVLLFAVWFVTLSMAVDAAKDKNAAVRFLGYLALIVVTIFEFVIILNQYFGIKLSDLLL